MPPTQDPPPTLSMTNIDHALNQLKDETSDAEFRAALETCHKIVSNLLAKPGDPKPRSIKFTNKTFQEKLGRFRAGLLLVEAIGFQYHGPDDTVYLRAESPLFTRQLLQALDQHLFHYKAADAVANQLAPAIHALGGGSRGGPMEVEAPSQKVAVGGSFLTATELKVEKLREEKEATLKQDPKFDRELRLFLPNDPKAEERIDEKEFLLNGEDLKQLSIASKKRKAGDGPEMLKTKAMKELERLQSLKVYSKAILRVILPNQCILQASFHPREPLGAVPRFLERCLAADKPKFELLTGSPLKPIHASGVKTSIVAEGLTPTAVMHFRWVGEPPEGPLLREHVTAGLTEAIPEVEKPSAVGPTLAAGSPGSAAPARKAGGGAAQRTAEAKKAVEDRLKAFMGAQ